jgi:4-amino-4-deoxy-L-arabinose transferase-like glycosyltransferase
VLRVLSVLLTTGVVLITFHVARRLFPREPEVICAVTAVVLFLPMHTFVGASANNDALAELIGSLAILLCVDLAARGLSLPRLLALGLVSTLALLTKRTTLFVVILSLLVSAWSLIRWIWQLGLRRALSGLLLLVVLLAVVRNAGEGLPLLLDWEGQRPAFFPTRVSTEAKPYQVFLPYMVDESLPPPTLSQRATNWLMRQIGGRVSHWVATEWAGLVNPQPHLSIRGLVACLGITFASFWGNFGWLNVPLSLGWYSVLLVATAISVAGLIRLSILLARKRIRCNLERRRGFAVVLGAAVLCSAQLLGTMVARVQPQQGRYLFPALPAFAILLVLGWFYVVPSRWRKGVPWLVTVGLVLLDTVALVYTIIPFYYG